VRIIWDEDDNPDGNVHHIAESREAQGLTWYSLADKARLPSANIVRDIEYGREVTLANIEAVVAALGLKLELVGQAD
jgi:hypothetical protein